MKRLDNGLPWPALAQGDERILMSLIRNGYDKAKTATEFQVKEHSIRCAASRINRIINTDTIQEAGASYQQFRESLRSAA